MFFTQVHTLSAHWPHFSTKSSRIIVLRGAEMALITLLCSLIGHWKFNLTQKSP